MIRRLLHLAQSHGWRVGGRRMDLDGEGMVRRPGRLVHLCGWPDHPAARLRRPRGESMDLPNASRRTESAAEVV
jgi:hypothetical protein